MREILDILDRRIGVGDIVLRPIQARMTKVYILAISAKGVWISRRKVIRTNQTNYAGKPIKDYVYTDTYINIEMHNDKQYLRWAPDFYILEKNAVIPENLKQFIKY
jgi:hypothetical protein